MATYRGMDGYLALGGYIVGTANPRVTAARTAGDTTLTVGATVTLYGVIMPGDTFTLGGEAGSPVHTVTGAAPYVSAANTIGPITFSTVIAAGGTLINATFNLASSSIANAKMHEITTALEVMDASVFSTTWKNFVGGIGSWTGRGEAWLDYGDPPQKEFLDALVAAQATASGVIFGINPTAGVKQFYGLAIFTGATVGAQIGALISVTFTFTGSGTILPNWN